MLSLVQLCFGLYLRVFTFLLLFESTCSQFEWITYDTIDEIMDRMNSVNSINCFEKQPIELVLPEESVYQKPSIEMLRSDIILRNRTQLLHVRNIAHRNAVLFSYLFQKLFDLDEPGLMYILLHNAADITGGRGMLNGSGVFFDQDTYYPHWYKNYFNKTIPLFGPYAWRADDFFDPFNWRNEWTNNTIQVEDIGAGRNHQYTSRYNRAHEWYSKWLPDRSNWDEFQNELLDSFVIPQPYMAPGTHETKEDRQWQIDDSIANITEPEQMIGSQSEKLSGKPVHHVELIMAEKLYKLKDVPEIFEFYGPPHPEDPLGPTRWTRPYFDCGRSNKWVISAVSPIVDIYPRHTEYRHMQSMKHVAVSLAEIDFLMLDINQCSEPWIIDSPTNQFNLFAGTHKCKPTTRCEPLSGFGFRRGGYQCMCQAGFRYPPYQDGPFKGYIIEKATKEEYRNNFDCIKIDLYQQVAYYDYSSTTEIAASRIRRSDSQIKNSSTWKSVSDDSEPLTTRNIFLDSFKRFISIDNSISKIFIFIGKSLFTAKDDEQKISQKKKRSKRFSHDYPSRVTSIMDLYERYIFEPNLCEWMNQEDLIMPGDVLHDIENQFESQARLALTLAHFLSSFYQIVNPSEDFSIRRAEIQLTDEQIIGEVLSAVAADYKVVGVGVFFDRGKFEHHHLPFFGPYAFRTNAFDTRKYTVIDWAGLPKGYEDEHWFRTIKSRWATNADRSELTEHWLKLFIRSDYQGNTLVHHESGFPLYSFAPELKHGQWFPPRFQCVRNQTLPRQWIVTYAVPFFGLDQIGFKLEFKGIVRVDVQLSYLDINQCSMPYHVPNAFKGSDRCDYQSTVCEQIPGRGFRLGKYKCRCRPGYEYPFLGHDDFFTGDKIDTPLDMLLSNSSHWTRYSQYKCRIAQAHSVSSLNWMFMLALCILTISNRQ